MNDPETLPAGLAGATGSEFRFSRQFRLCREDGTAKKMTARRRESMPQAERELYDAVAKFQKEQPRLYGCGPLFCGKQPAMCRSSHCRRLHTPNDKRSDGNVKGTK